ncbi:hypothetical protein HYALB_00011916 [Hymenoscyphus albidus]|uniref:Heterokaryon incompatibility domain-containing protein n=1 Tax=Hymenoscyphus albidus TaxID=595503 RepID=A0A9N9Q9L0_9HELO|nr:hypothetical protein HYALB_00011916 [Hymenoscyphus albidus]
MIQTGGHRILQLFHSRDLSMNFNNGTQIAFPVLPTPRCPLRFALLRAWLQSCDEHDKCKPTGSHRSPTRLLYVGNPDSSTYDPRSLELVLGDEIAGEKYIALSHRWGLVQPNKVPEHCTTIANLSSRRGGFAIDELPLTFRDVVEVARCLKVQYLWLDSLCIVQGSEEDWERESKCMEDIYSSAYFTLAATAAVDSNSGFLQRNITSEYVCIQDDSGQLMYTCTCPADFDREVDQAPLNKRAWVMQERFLSRRTIHFGANQMYWECGEGVYCENLTRLKSNVRTNKEFKLDPQFPKLLFNSGYSATLAFLSSFLEDYSNRHLTKPTDRVRALSGLTARIEQALSCEENFSIFELYLHRNLLWERTGPMERINYESQKVPSWSWMAYTGGIKFIDDLYGNLEIFIPLEFFEEDKKMLQTDVWRFEENCHLGEESEGEFKTRRQILNSLGQKVGWLSFDVEDRKEFRGEQVVVVGKKRQVDGSENQMFHVLLVRQSDGAENEFERVGMGMVQQGYLSRQQRNVCII